MGVHLQTLNVILSLNQINADRLKGEYQVVAERIDRLQRAINTLQEVSDSFPAQVNHVRQRQEELQAELDPAHAEERRLAGELEKGAAEILKYEQEIAPILRLEEEDKALRTLPPDPKIDIPRKPLDLWPLNIDQLEELLKAKEKELEELKTLHNAFGDEINRLFEVREKALNGNPEVYGFYVEDDEGDEFESRPNAAEVLQEHKDELQGYIDQRNEWTANLNDENEIIRDAAQGMIDHMNAQIAIKEKKLKEFDLAPFLEARKAFLTKEVEIDNVKRDIDQIVDVIKRKKNGQPPPPPPKPNASSASGSAAAAP